MDGERPGSTQRAGPLTVGETTFAGNTAAPIAVVLAVSAAIDVDGSVS